MAVQKVFLLACFLCVAYEVNAASKDEILRTSLYRLAEGHMEKNGNRPLSSLPTRKTTTKVIPTKATTLKPVYIPALATVQPTTESTTKKVVEATTKTTAEQTVIAREPDHAFLDTTSNSNHANKTVNDPYSFVVEKKEHVKTKANPKHEEIAHTTIQPADQREPHHNEIAEEKSGSFAAALIPFAASIGTALAIGGLAYYAYPVPEITARTDRFDAGSFDNGVRVVQSSDLTPQEIRRLMNAEAYHVSARSSTDERKPHPYIDLANRFIQYAAPVYDYITPVYQYLAPSFLGGNSDEEDTENEYDIGSIQSKQPFVGPGYTNRLIQPIYNGGPQNIGQHIIGQPNIGHGQPTIGQHILGQPNIGQHINGQPNIGHGQPTIGQHFNGQPNIGHGQPTIGQHILGQPNIDQNILAQPHVGQHIIRQQNIGQPNIGQPIFGQPNIGQHVIGHHNLQPNAG